MSDSSSSSSASSVVNFAPRNHRHVWNLLLSVPVLFFLRLLAKSTPYAKQGFFCNDNEIRYPYVHDTVPAGLLDWVFVIVGTAAIVGSECSLVRHLTRRNSGKRLLHLGIHGTGGSGARLFFHPLAINCCYFLAALLCQNFSTSSICDLGKRTCSRLRPNFVDVCQPRNLSGLCPPDYFGYVQDYECTNVLFDQNEYFSFPSGHAAHVCSFAVFLIFYLQKRCKLPPAVRSFVQFFIALFAYFVCLSRVRDHKHRLTDVAGGALTGMALGGFFVRFVLLNFRPNRYPLVDRQDWPEMEDGRGGLMIGHQLSVPQTVVKAGKEEAEPRGKTPILLGGHKHSASDYGSLAAFSGVDMFGNGRGIEEQGGQQQQQQHPRLSPRANSVSSGIEQQQRR